MKSSHTQTQRARALKSAHSAHGSLQRLAANGYRSRALDDSLKGAAVVIDEITALPVTDHRVKQPD